MIIDKQSDFHMHTVFSDGVAQVDEMVSAAIKKGLRTITITDHMPLPFENRYAMRLDDLETYRHQIRSAQRKYNGHIVVKMGLEFEYSQQHEEWIRSIVDMGWDHLLVSVHSLIIDEHPCMANGNEGEFITLLERCDNDIEQVCRHYFGTVQLAVRTGWFDIVGHLDVIKKHNVNGRYFSESASWYRSMVLETLDLIQQSGMTVEVNMAGMNHPAGAQYPSRWILQEAATRGIPFVSSSDAHKPDLLGQHFQMLEGLITPPPA